MCGGCVATQHMKAFTLTPAGHLYLCGRDRTDLRGVGGPMLSSETGRAFAAGGAAGVAETLVTMPFELTKNRIQMRHGPSTIPANMMDTVRRAGLPGLYYGVQAQLLQVAFKSGIRFAAVSLGAGPHTPHSLPCVWPSIPKRPNERCADVRSHGSLSHSSNNTSVCCRPGPRLLRGRWPA
jgi:hypothetical protein